MDQACAYLLGEDVVLDDKVLVFIYLAEDKQKSERHRDVVFESQGPRKFLVSLAGQEIRNGIQGHIRARLKALSLVVPAMGFRGSAEISWMGSVMRLTGDSKELH